jgi:hypothetical protein
MDNSRHPATAQRMDSCSEQTRAQPLDNSSQRTTGATLGNSTTAAAGKSASVSSCFDEDRCIFCCKVINSSNSQERLSVVTTGLDSIKTACVAKQEGKLLDYLNMKPEKVLAHSSCRKQFTYVKQELKRKITGRL